MVTQTCADEILLLADSLMEESFLRAQQALQLPERGLEEEDSPAEHPIHYSALI